MQVLGANMDEESSFVRISLDGEASPYDTHHLSGRAAVTSGNHTIRVQLHARGGTFPAQVAPLSHRLAPITAPRQMEAQSAGWTDK
jgi:hypothetical protein